MRARNNALLSLAFALLLLSGQPCLAGPPDWVRAASRLPLPTYRAETNAVLLLEDQVTTVSDNGEVKVNVRRVYKILRPEGASYGLVSVGFDADTRITYLKGWSITAGGAESDIKEKEALESGASEGVFFQDSKYKTLRIPHAEPGSIIAYEFEQRRRPTVQQEYWFFQRDIPVRMARLTIEAPASWILNARWQNWQPVEPARQGDKRRVWQLENIPAVEAEASMPPWRSIAGHLGVAYSSPGAVAAQPTWQGIGGWLWGLVATQRRSSPALQAQARTIAGSGTRFQQIRRLSQWVQGEIRYVAIVIGMSGYQPHAASNVLTNRYGDCKDKATLLSALLSEVGVNSYYLYVNTERGVVDESFPTALSFDHVILAIRMPDEVDLAGENLPAVVTHPRLGRLLLFDPTDNFTPFGWLPTVEQKSIGLLVSEEEKTLLPVPLLPPAANRVVRKGTFTIAADASLSGEVEETRLGAHASMLRATLAPLSREERDRMLEEYVGGFILGATVSNIRLEGLQGSDSVLMLRYKVTTERYLQRSGDLLMFRPRFLGTKADTLTSDRKLAYEFDQAASEEDIIDIRLPAEYEVDDMPAQIAAKQRFASYQSAFTVNGDSLRYARRFEVTDIHVPPAEFSGLRALFQDITQDERATVVLRRRAPAH